uniref:Uncharacterized protein n=1 Tax=Strombidium inclinatum TaxID=197538 RepID=A0A7S3IVY4_9SPIT
MGDVAPGLLLLSVLGFNASEKAVLLGAVLPLGLEGELGKSRVLGRLRRVLQGLVTEGVGCFVGFGIRAAHLLEQFLLEAIHYTRGRLSWWLLLLSRGLLLLVWMSSPRLGNAMARLLKPRLEACLSAANYGA